MSDFHCCLLANEPSPWKAGVDDSADPEMVQRMNRIRDRLSYKIPTAELIAALEEGANMDTRTLLGRDIQRCLLSNAAHRLRTLSDGNDDEIHGVPRSNAHSGLRFSRSIPGAGGCASMIALFTIIPSILFLWWFT